MVSGRNLRRHFLPRTHDSIYLVGLGGGIVRKGQPVVVLGWAAFALHLPAEGERSGADHAGVQNAVRIDARDVFARARTRACAAVVCRAIRNEPISGIVVQSVPEHDSRRGVHRFGDRGVGDGRNRRVRAMERHDVADVGERPQPQRGIRGVAPLGAGHSGGGEHAVVARHRVARVPEVAGVAHVQLLLNLVQSVRLLDRKLVGEAVRRSPGESRLARGVSVVPLLVAAPDQDSAAGQRDVAALLLAVLDQVVLRVIGRMGIAPYVVQAVGDGYGGRRRRQVLGRHPAGRRAQIRIIRKWILGVGEAHQAEIAHAGLRVFVVVEVGKAADHVPVFVAERADARAGRHGRNLVGPEIDRLAVHLDGHLLIVERVEIALVRPQALAPGWRLDAGDPDVQRLEERSVVEVLHRHLPEQRQIPRLVVGRGHHLLEHLGDQLARPLAEGYVRIVVVFAWPGGHEPAQHDVGVGEVSARNVLKVLSHGGGVRVARAVLAVDELFEMRNGHAGMDLCRERARRHPRRIRDGKVDEQRQPHDRSMRLTARRRAQDFGRAGGPAPCGFAARLREMLHLPPAAHRAERLLVLRTPPHPLVLRGLRRVAQMERHLRKDLPVARRLVAHRNAGGNQRAR